MFHPGSIVAYWRSQKWQDGVLHKEGRWYGPAIVLGQVGRNVVLVHKKHIFRCAPEQVRVASTEERELLRSPHSELIGIKQAFEAGEIQSKQYVDLVPQGYPSQEVEMKTVAASPLNVSPEPPGCREDQASSSSLAPRSVLELSQPSSERSELERASETYPEDPLVRHQQKAAPYESGGNDKTPNVDKAASEYGPVRRRVPVKSGEPALFRPAALQEGDFAEMMQDIMPSILKQMPSDGEDTSLRSTSPRVGGTKRGASKELPEAAERAQSGPSLIEPPEEKVTYNDENEILMCQTSVPAQSTSEEQELLESSFSELGSSDATEMWQALMHKTPVDVLIAQYQNKRAAKEMAGVGNPPELQKKVDEAKVTEWQVIESKNAGRLILGQQAEAVRCRLSHRIMDSRYVMTMKQEEDSDPRVKARWCLLGHRDPDLSSKAEAGDLQSPTLSQVGRSVLFQVIASQQWQLALGDIKGAFLSAGELPAKYRPLYARLPPGGIPGVPDDALIEITGHAYGLNDSPAAWQQKLNQVLLSVGFEPSRFDPCLYYLRDQGRLVGIYGVHVDDCATGGAGQRYEKAMIDLKQAFEFRKWRLWDGDFCGARYTQNEKTFEISMSQAKFVEKIRPMHLSRTRCQDKDSVLNDKEVSCLRAINGSLNWLCTQSRPDLSTQVSFSQQAFPNPTVADALAANNAVRRAKQHADLCIVYQSIPMQDLSVLCHSDAAYANTKGNATQGGYVVGFTHKNIDNSQTCKWTPAFWKSHRLPRMVNSTLSAEAQSMSWAASMCEWISLVVAEAISGRACAQTLWKHPSRPLCVLVTDCKSLYDHLKSPSAPSLDDRRTSIDIVIIREALRRMDASLRWIPTDRMLADSMTKESPDALDLLRACLRCGSYQISPEETVLEWRASERSRRKEKAAVAVSKQSK